MSRILSRLLLFAFGRPAAAFLASLTSPSGAIGLLGQIAFVRSNIELILILVVFLSIIPIIVELLRARRGGKGAHAR